MALDGFPYEEKRGCRCDGDGLGAGAEEDTSRSAARTRRRRPRDGGAGADDEKELHVAPMLDYSKREFRVLLSILSSRLVPWTEMVVDDTIAHSTKLDDHLESDFGLFDNDVVCQIGGNDPTLCGRAVREVRRYGYGEVNLNVDCPSDRVAGRREFGAVLMREDKIDRCVQVVKAMVEAAASAEEEADGEEKVPPATGAPFDGNDDSGGDSIRVSVKCRIGVDAHDSLAYASLFISRLRDEAGCRRFVLHARKCVLGGLMSARQNRSVPPLNYPRVYDLCRAFPDCEFWVNGGIGGLMEARELCYGRHPDGGEEESTDGAEVGVGACDATDVEKGADSACDNDADATEEKKEIEGGDAVTSTRSSSAFPPRRRRHAVPCDLCSLSHGSCTAPLPPSSVPTNLRGVMLGRAAIANPSLFWDVDRYFYGASANPCRNRREVLEKYAEYLEGLYPRRCCDDSDEVTWKVPVPAVRRVRECEICREFYGRDDASADAGYDRRIGGEEMNAAAPQPLPSSSTPTPTPTEVKVIKMAPRIVGRSLKPVRGIFFGLPGAKVFVRELDRLGMDKSVRDCGPGYILRRAMAAVPEEALEREFVRTEDLKKPSSSSSAATERAGKADAGKGENGRSCCGL